MRPRIRTEHGQYGFARREKCKCDPCVKAVRRYVKHRRIDAERGQNRKVDAGPVREHIEKLFAEGVSVTQLSKATDGQIARSQIKRILDGRSYRVHRRTEQTLLAITAKQAKGSTFTFVDSIGLQRRIQALRWMGYPIRQISAEMGIGWSNLYEQLARDRVRTTTVASADEVYRRLSMTVGPDEAERWVAYRNGWAPPMAWDDDTIDDPNAEPEPTRCIVENCARTSHKRNLCLWHHRHVVERGALARAQAFRRVVGQMGKRQTHGAGGQDRLRTELAELKAMGISVQEAAERVGHTPKYVQRIWERSDVA